MSSTGYLSRHPPSERVVEPWTDPAACCSGPRSETDSINPQGLFVSNSDRRPACFAVVRLRQLARQSPNRSVARQSVPGDTAGCNWPQGRMRPPAVISRGTGPQGTVLTDVTPPTYKEPGRKDGCQRCRQPTYEVQVARRALTVLAIVDRQRVQPQGGAHMRQQSTTRTRPQGTVHPVSTGSSEPTTG